MGTKYLSREDVLTADDLKTEEIKIPEWDGKTLIVRALTGKEKDIFFGSLIDKQGNPKQKALENATARAISLCVIDEKGERLFTRSDVDALGDKNGMALSRVWVVIQRISGLSPKSIKALTENLDEGQTEISTSS